MFFHKKLFKTFYLTNQLVRTVGSGRETEIMTKTILRVLTWIAPRNLYRKHLKLRPTSNFGRKKYPCSNRTTEMEAKKQILQRSRMLSN